MEVYKAYKRFVEDVLKEKLAEDCPYVRYIVNAYGAQNDNVEREQMQGFGGNQENFTGAATLSANHWWLTKSKEVNETLLNIMRNYDGKPTTIEDLPLVKVAPVGSVTRSSLIKNQIGKSYDPAELYMVLENADYSLRNFSWLQHFPPFLFPGDAINGMTALLNAYHLLLTSGKSENAEAFPFERDHLVMVKCYEKSLDKQDKSAPTRRYQMRRGMIVKVSVATFSPAWRFPEGQTPPVQYTVFLLDFGVTLLASHHFLTPLPKPFDSIAPLAIKCSLHGISPLLGYWNPTIKSKFTDYVNGYKQEKFNATILSKPSNPESTIYVSIDIVGLKNCRHIFNLTQYMINEGHGVQWNLFPARPSLMGSTSSNAERAAGPKIQYKDALILTSAATPVVSRQLDFKTVKRDLAILLNLNCEKWVPIAGLNNFIALSTPVFEDPEKKAVALASSIPTTGETSTLLQSMRIPPYRRKQNVQAYLKEELEGRKLIEELRKERKHRERQQAALQRLLGQREKQTNAGPR